MPNGSAKKRAPLAEEQTGGGKVVVDTIETVKHALGPDTIHLLQLENGAPIQRATVLCGAIKYACIAHSQACPATASVAPAGEGMQNGLRPDEVMTSWRRHLKDDAITRGSAAYRGAIQTTSEQYQAAQRTVAIGTASEPVERFLGPGAAFCGWWL